MAHQRLARIGRACGRESAAGRTERREPPLIEGDQSHEDPRHGVPPGASSLARRRARTLRPPLVFILSRNPCVRFRAKFEGCRIVADMRNLPTELVGPARGSAVPDTQYLWPYSINAEGAL